MGFFDRFRKVTESDKNLLRKVLNNVLKSNGSANYAKSSSTTNQIRDAEPTPDFGGSRTSIPKFVQGGGGAFGALPRKTQTDLGLDERRMNQYSVDDLIDILTDAHPDVGFALWNFMRMSNSGYTITCTALDSDEQDKDAEMEIAYMLKQFELPNTENFEKSRSLDRVIKQLIMSVITRGAASCELVLTPDGNDVAFIAPIDPSTIDFLLENDRFVPYQDRESINLDIPTFFYEGLDERIDDPYGRSPIRAALSMVLFQLQVLNDIKAVVHNQGYPRIDLKIIEEVLLKRMPLTIRSNESKKQEWLTTRLTDIIEMYSALEPDDAYVHFDSLEVGMVGGGSGGGAMLDPQKLMSAIDNLVMSGLKTLSTILGRRSTGNTESFAKIEIKLYLKGVEDIQEVVETILSRALTLALNIKGKQGIVKFRFNPLEIRTDLEKSQMEQIKFINLAFARDQGWISQEEASIKAVGHDSVSEPDWEHLQPIKNKDGETPKGSKDTKSDS